MSMTVLAEDARAGAPAEGHPMGKYDPLTAYLRQQTAAGARVLQIDDALFARILSGDQPQRVSLPPAAWVPAASFWGNTAGAQRSRAAAWLRAGWQVRHPVDYVNRVVTFER
jgi:hypothetical protein